MEKVLEVKKKKKVKVQAAVFYWNDTETDTEMILNDAIIYMCYMYIMMI